MGSEKGFDRARGLIGPYKAFFGRRSRQEAAALEPGAMTLVLLEGPVMQQRTLSPA